jgi:hypothetical protein
VVQWVRLPNPAWKESQSMMDLLLLTVLVGFFMLTAALVRLAEKLGSTEVSR